MGISQSNASTIEKKNEVFLNFRGIDTRYGFTNYLYQALRFKSIETFMDDHGIPKGDVIGPELLKAIRESKISVVIFSKEYASSKWCLRELVEIMKRKEKNEQIVIPVFYQVEVSDVKGSFMKGFDKLKKIFEENLENKQLDSADVEKRKKEFYEEIPNWRQALEDASKVKGWEVKRSEPEVINEIVNDIWEKLMSAYKMPSCDFKGLFGIQERLKQIKSLLCLDKLDIRIIGIWGMGGIGKTTIANAIFHQISDDEYGKCFIRNVRQRLEESAGLVSVLQQEILSKVLNHQNIKLDGVTLPQDIKRRLHGKNVFIVLDDVDNFFKLEELAAGLDGLGPGSRIVITTRNRDVLKMCEVNDDYIYEVKRLSDEEAQKLFCEYASKQSPLTKDLKALSHEILLAINGNPLGLKVAGSLLGSKKVKYRQSALNKLKRSSEILEVLQISYNGLEDEDKHAFLDIACFFVGKREDYVAEILDNSYSLEVLSNRSLITISDHMIIGMHDLLQEMGRKIVCKESLNNPGKRSRLWVQEDILDTLENVAGTDEIRGIFLNMSQMNEEYLSSQVFEKMTNLKFLKFYDSTFYQYTYFGSKLYSSKLRFSNGLSYLSNKLRSLNWLGYPLKALPSNFNPKHLVELDLMHSNIEKLWEKNTCAPKLKWIFLMYCPYLIQVLDLLYAPELENIVVQDCESLLGLASPNEFQSLKYIHFSRCNNLTWIPYLNARLLERIDIDKCKNLLGFPSPAHPFNNLRVLNLRFCNNLQSFPNEIRFPSLVSLNLFQCTKLARISDILDAPLLETINLRGCTSLLDFPRPAQHFNELCMIDLEDCSSLLYFPAPCPHGNSLCNIHFPSLKCLDFHWCIKLTVFPCISGNIEKLCMSETAIHEVPSSIENLPDLVELGLAKCTSLKHISSNIHKLKALRELNLRNCSSLEFFPEISDTMGSLEILDLRGTAIKGLHHSIENLSGLKKLFLSKCKNLDEVPSSIEKLTELLVLDLEECASLKHISFNICKLKALSYLNLRNCSALECFLEISDTMESLEILDLTGTAIKGLHHSIEKLSGLKQLSLKECENLDEVPTSIENLTELVKLNLTGCISLKHISFNISKMKALGELSLHRCSALECFPEISDTMESLETLDLTGTAIRGLHHSIDKLTSVETLWLCGCKSLEMLPISIYNLTSLSTLDLSCCSKLENLPMNSVTDLSNYGESTTTEPPICKLSECKLHLTNCPNLSKTAVNIMELQIKQHRDMTIKGCGTQDVNLKFCYPESEVPGWFKRQTNGSSINIQMSGHDRVNGHLIGLAACAVIEFYDADEGNDDEGSDDESYDEESCDTIHYDHNCHCKGDSRLINSYWIYCSSSFTLSPHEDANSDHVVLWYSNALVSELCDECTNYLFRFYFEEGKNNYRVKHCGVCPIYETCGAIDQDFGETSFKEKGKVRKFSDEADTSGGSNEDVREPHRRRT